MFRHHYQTTAEVRGSPQALFELLDDFERLGSHMSRSSLMMAGSKMNYAFDEGKGQRQGSKVCMSGRVLGLNLSVEEVVTERLPPLRKVWKTAGNPRLLVIGDYRMGFDIDGLASGSRLTIYIDYDDPPRWRWAAWLAGSFYARWCVNSMVAVATSEFGGEPIRQGMASGEAR